MTFKRLLIAALTIAVFVVSPVQHAIGFRITDTAGDKSLVTGTSISATTPWVFTLKFETIRPGQILACAQGRSPTLPPGSVPHSCRVREGRASNSSRSLTRRNCQGTTFT